jgi:putative transposase
MTGGSVASIAVGKYGATNHPGAPNYGSGANDVRASPCRQRIILIWDGLPAHKSREMQDYLHAEHRWLQVERLPGYAPELNPTESQWENLKGQELANFCGESLRAAANQCREGVRRVRRRISLLFSFLKHAGLSL